MCKPGTDFNTAVNDVAARTITEGLIDLGLLSGSVDANIESGAFKRYYMHRIGHYLGMDTHDVGSYRDAGGWRALRPGMIVTVEPGIYVPDEPDVDERFRGIGVRIEDNVLITDSGHDNLSAGTPKTIDEVETTIAEGRASRVPVIA
jgi:Xaa-Pro aminopeptidase